MVVDHIKPLALGGSDEDRNTRNLCDPHHLEVTAEQFGHAVARGARGVGRDGRPVGRDHEWNRSGHITPSPAAGRRPTPRGGRKSEG
ncbi:HNH endonuclease signature motif containing protein [Sphingomonas sp. H39-1-10]|uniref:HNH endonuclease signature motif containing protein n=1 Tax=Sphingomonas pollutisoli TaxID=3030829 RepID=UPI0023BA1FD5|nr:HNH endonuclease signature motif containing protein [Sphingomonas pollutisoli]MDF0489197.1 HNH endonuclease signature motif containing protein [Sphingomonas pollutisoli]